MKCLLGFCCGLIFLIGGSLSGSFLSKEAERHLSPRGSFAGQERVIRPISEKIRVRGRNVRRERTTWARVYGGSYVDGARDVRPTRDGGFIIASSIHPDVWTEWSAAWLIKVSSEGEIEWQRKYEESNNMSLANAVQQTADGGYVVAGEIRLANDPWSADGFVCKLTSTGDLEWARAYGGDSEDELASIQETSDGGYIAAGFSTRESWSDFWVLKIFADGDIEWQYRYGGERSDEAVSITQTGDGGYIVAGETDSFGDEYHDFWVLRLSSTGAIDWQCAYGDHGRDWTSEYAYCVQPTMDGGCVVAGTLYSFDAVSLSMNVDVWILKLNPSGEIEWQRRYDTGASDSARFVEQTGDGGYIVAGRAEFFREDSLLRTGSSDTDVCILKLDNKGDIEWERAYGWIGGDAPSCIHQLNDSGYVVGGSSSSYLGRGPSELLVFRIGGSGGMDGLPEFVGATRAEVLDTHFPPRTTWAQAANMDSPARAVVLEAQDTSETSDLLFSPPLNLKGETVLNRSVSLSESTHALSWEPNPNYDDLRIEKYRLYRMGGEAGLIAEIDANVFSFIVRHIWKELAMGYSVSAVTEEGDEGLRAFVTVR